MNTYDIDKTDRKILTALQQDSRKPFIELAKEIGVSGGTIHVRVNKLKAAGVIQGTKAIIDYKILGYNVAAFVGLRLHNASDYKKVLKMLERMEQVVEAHYTTGLANIFTKVLATSNRDLQIFLVETLQEIPEIQSTETAIVLDTPIQRELSLSL